MNLMLISILEPYTNGAMLQKVQLFCGCILNTRIGSDHWLPLIITTRDTKRSFSNR